MRKIVYCLTCLLLLTACTPSKEIEKIDISTINQINDSDADKFDFSLHSAGYILVRLNDLKILYKDNSSERIYPASLTKIFTLNAVLKKVENLDDTSSVTSKQMDHLIAQESSLAGLQTDRQYSISDLLYALILPSGGDAAVALENYFASIDLDLVEEMNNVATSIGCKNTNFRNTTGLHDDKHYTSLDDLLLCIMDCLNYSQGRQLLESISYKLSDGEVVKSSLYNLRNDKVNILGGKTGFTLVAGQLIIVFYEVDNRTYLLMLSNSDGNSYLEQYYHFEDCINIFERLYD